jgi:DNA-binding NarL/FixJ family response regulator
VALRVVIVDDHPAFRRLAGRLLRAGGFEVVGEAADAASALAEVVATRPDVVLLDILLPGADGFAVAEQLARLVDPPAVVLVSSRTRADFGERLATAPARGFLPKELLTAAAVASLAEG